MRLDPDTLTVAEAVAIEQATGLNLLAVEFAAPTLTLLAGLYWIAASRAVPATTWGEVCALPVLGLDLTIGPEKVDGD
jgi:hypothetical protein